MENEAHVATIGLLKLQNSTWQESVSTLVKHHQSQVDEMATAQEAGLKAVQERFVEAEKKFLAASKEMAVEVAALKRENAALKESVGGSVASSGNDTAVSDVSALRAEISKLEERVKECQMEKLTVVERLKVRGGGGGNIPLALRALHGITAYDIST